MRVRVLVNICGWGVVGSSLVYVLDSKAVEGSLSLSLLSR